MQKLRHFTGAYAFFMAVFLNAFVDLGHKIVIQNTVFKLYDGPYQVILTAIVNGLILLPFILLLSPAGFVSDRFRKTEVMRYSGWAALIACCMVTVCYYQGWFWPALGMTFLLAAQSALYSPAKYGFIKQLFGKSRLGEANGVVASLSILAILSGTFAYSIAFESLFPEGAQTEAEIILAIAPIGWLLILSSLIELIMMYRIPQLESESSAKNFKWKKFLSGQMMRSSLEPLSQARAIRLSVIGLAVFWAVGQVMLAAFPAFLKDEMGVTNTIVVQGILACTGLGIAIGAMFAGRFSRNYIETGLLPIGALGLAIGLFILPGLQSTYLAGLNFFFIGLMGGIFIVPLNALIQFFAEEDKLGKTLAASNWVQNISMLSFLLITVSFSLLGWTSKSLLQLIAVVALIGSFYTIYQLPQSLTRFILTCFFSSRYRIKVQGMKNIPAQGGVLLLGNHISWIDWAIIQIASPRPVRFVMINTIYERWYLKWLFDLFACIPIQSNAASRKSLETIAKCLDNGEVVCLFPEGAISRNGHLAEFKKGYEHACGLVNNDIKIIPFYLHGLWGSRFSRSSERLKRTSSHGITRNLSVAFGTPLDKGTNADLLKHEVQSLSIESWQEYVDTFPSIGEQWLETSCSKGNPTVLIDTMGTSLKSKSALTGSVVMARKMAKLSPEQNIGILLPTSAAGMLANMAVMLLGKTIVNLNFSASQGVIHSALEQSGIQTIYTSTRFLKKLETRGLDIAALKQEANLVMLEDIQASISTLEKALTLLEIHLLPTFILKRMFCKKTKIHSTAVILFSSGSEGAPKGILLSHKNLMTNVKQVAEMLNLEDDDVVLANLPLFHAFGLTITQFMPLLERVPVVCHSDPTDVYGAAKAISQHQVTTMFGTSSFYRLYIRNKKVHPLMLDSLRVIIAGAERLQDEVRIEFKLKFNKDILEGYGATETAPVASVNIPDILSTENWKVQLGTKIKSVGMPLPGTSFKIVDPDSFSSLPTNEAGMILISGAQVMSGYLNDEEKSAQVLREIDGSQWYVSGDKGYLDEDGFLFIKDRYSRFSKIGGEMIGLGSVEQAIHDVVDDRELEIVAVGVPDARKGEKIVVLSNKDLDISMLKEKLLKSGLSSLALPSSVLKVEEMPTLGSGKTDFVAAKKMALANTSK